MVLKVKAGAPTDMGGGVGTEAFLLLQVSKGLLGGEEHRAVKTSSNLVRDSGKPIRPVRTNVVGSVKWGQKRARGQE